jgi:hypothetical protein
MQIRVIWMPAIAPWPAPEPIADRSASGGKRIVWRFDGRWGASVFQRGDHAGARRLVAAWCGRGAQPRCPGLMRQLRSAIGGVSEAA